MPKPTALELFEDLLSVAAPSGAEAEMGRSVGHHLDAFDWPYETDPSGNLVVEIAGSDPEAPTCALLAHMDEIAMVVTAVEESGSLRVSPSGGLYPWKLGEGAVDVLGDVQTLVGVLSMGSGHAPNLEKRPIEWESVFIRTGLSKEAVNDAGVRPGTPAVPAAARRGPVIFGDPHDPMIGAWTFDNRVSVVAVLRMLATLREEEIEPAHPWMVAFTTHEETGCHGAKSLAHRLRAEVVFAIDGCPIMPGIDVALDGRLGIRSKDPVAIYDQRLLRQALCVAERANVALEPIVYARSSTEAAQIFAMGGAARVASLGAVRANSHGYEVMRHATFDNLTRLLVDLVQERF